MNEVLSEIHSSELKNKESRFEIKRGMPSNKATVQGGTITISRKNARG